MEGVLRLSPSRALQERRLTTLLAGRDPAALSLDQAVADEQVLGSLALAGVSAERAQVEAAHRGQPAPEAVAALVRARRAVDAKAPLTAAALLAWDRALGGRGFRTGELSREGGPPPAPAAFIPGRLRILEDWLGADSARELTAGQRGALVLARLIEILPLDRKSVV